MAAFDLASLRENAAGRFAGLAILYQPHWPARLPAFLAAHRSPLGEPPSHLSFVGEIRTFIWIGTPIHLVQGVTSIHLRSAPNIGVDQENR